MNDLVVRISTVEEATEGVNLAIEYNDGILRIYLDLNAYIFCTMAAAKQLMPLCRVSLGQELVDSGVVVFVDDDGMSRVLSP